ADGERPITVRGQFFANPKRELNGVPGRIELSSGGAWMTTPPGQTPEPPRPARGAQQCVQADTASLRKPHGRYSLPCGLLHYAVRLNLGVRPCFPHCRRRVFGRM